MKNLIILISGLLLLGCSKDYPPRVIDPNPIISIYQLKDLSYNDYIFITLDEDSNIVSKSTPYTYRWDKHNDSYGYYTISNEDLYENTYVTDIIIKQEFDSVRVIGKSITDSTLISHIIGTPYNKYMVINDYSLTYTVEGIRDSLYNGSLFKYCKILK